MPYALGFREAALKALEGFPTKIRRQVIQKARALEENPHPPGSKKLHDVSDGPHPVYRVRSGDYRVLYLCLDDEKRVLVIDVANRKDAYR